MISPVSFLPRLHARRAGEGPLIVCLHSSGSSSSQWQALMQEQQHRYSFIAVDFFGHGRSAAYDRPGYSLAAESNAVLALLDGVDTPVHLVGHSYGGAVALDLALRAPRRVASAAVFEPVLFGLLQADSPLWAPICKVGQTIVSEVEAGRLTAASATFIDYWSGRGTWQAMPPAARQRVEERIEAVGAHFTALFADPLPLAHLRALQAPTLLMHGDRSPAPAQAVVRRLADVGAIVTQPLPGRAHMAPVTDAAVVNAVIVEHIENVERRLGAKAA